MNEYDKEMIRTLGVVALILGAMAVAGMLICDAISRYSCNNYENVSGVETRYITFDTCYINTERGWQRWDEYKVRAFTNEE